MHVFAALLVIAATLTAQTGPVRGIDRKDLLVIEGARDPGQIPEWLAWEYSFTLLKDWQGRDSGFTHDLREAVSAQEFELLEKEALAQATRQARREARGARLLDKYPPSAITDPEVMAKANDEAFAIDLEYRRGILRSRDRLLQAFTAESQAVLLNWVAENKAAITSYVPKSDLKRWRLPE